ncbi:MAG: hypothetical protein KIS87_04845 [Phycisphaeraceae bacterium]|nr:hypothetical protein [Phycisphaeraceae bacterium]
MTPLNASMTDAAHAEELSYRRGYAHGLASACDVLRELGFAAAGEVVARFCDLAMDARYRDEDLPDYAHQLERRFMATQAGRA